MSTTAQQDRDFLGEVINMQLLEDAIEWIANNINPEDVFSTSQLGEWAVENDWTETS